MTRLYAAAIIACLAVPVSAEEPTGRSLMEEGARQFFRGLMDQMGPAIEGLEDLADEMSDFTLQMGPALQELLSKVEDWSVYHPPEILPNGDIIIRRKQDAPPPTTGEDGVIEL